jgi:hypothetical protein
MAVDGNLLQTPTDVKRQIMLNGGVIAVINADYDFFAYSSLVKQAAISAIYKDPPAEARTSTIAHAVFCFG